jgi:hypothetical protein
VGGELQISGVTVGSCANAGETSILSVKEGKKELLQSSLEDIEVKTDLCVPGRLCSGTPQHITQHIILTIALIIFGRQVIMLLNIELEETEEFGRSYNLPLTDSSSSGISSEIWRSKFQRMILHAGVSMEVFLLYMHASACKLLIVLIPWIWVFQLSFVSFNSLHKYKAKGMAEKTKLQINNRTEPKMPLSFPSFSTAS